MFQGEKAANHREDLFLEGLWPFLLVSVTM